MTIHLPIDLESSLETAVQQGRFASVDDAMAEAVRLLLRELDQWQDQNGVITSDLGSIGAMRDAGAELDEIVAEAYRQRRLETWRNVSLE